jgi:Rod binding domain-containing protein
MDSVVSSYNDFQGLAKLRAKAEKDQASAAREVGQQFEAFFHSNDVEVDARCGRGP